MLLESIAGASIAIVSGVIGFFIAKKIMNANFETYIEQAKAKAKVIESEAEILLKKASIRADEINIESRKDLELKEKRLRQELEGRDIQLAQREKRLDAQLEIKKDEFYKSEKIIKREFERIKQYELEVDRIKRAYEDKIEQSNKVLESGAGMTHAEAKELLLKEVEESSRADVAHIVRKYESEAREEAKERANYIIAQATTRLAGEFAQERLVNILHLPDDELKGRIIGKEGRNIKTLENLLGVDIIIDDTPRTILLSSFNLYRRAIATRTLEELISDGRIQPARIEEIYEKVSGEFAEEIQHEGEDIVMDLGLAHIHPEIIKLVGKLRYRASYGQNALTHTLEVAHLAGIMAVEMGGDEKLAVRAGLLHDIGKALTQEHGGSHVDLGAQICSRYNEDAVVINSIYAHHGFQEPESIEAAAVCTADALSAARPGARREVLESFLKRVEEIEKLAMDQRGVKQAYAINAGREVRVVVNAKLVNDDETALLAREIASNIQQSVQYPGEIKVNVIRETRAQSFAK